MIAETVAAQVRDLLRQVPRPPGVPAVGGADEVQVVALARRLGQALPAALVEWLRVCRGDVIGPGGVFGVRPDDPDLDIEHRRTCHPGFLEQGWLPVAGDGCGNVYVLVAQGPLAGMVGFVETVTDPDRIGYLVGSDLWHFLRFLFGKEVGERGWPFREGFVLALDPHLAAAPTRLLPWNT